MSEMLNIAEVDRARSEDLTGKLLLRRLRETERAESKALAAYAELMRDMLMAEEKLGLTPEIGHSAIETSYATIGRAIEARALTIKLHRSLATIGKREGIDLTAQGCGASCGDPSNDVVNPFTGG